MKTFEIKGNIRAEIGKKATKQLRREEKVPCVLYGGKENVHFSLIAKDFGKIIYTPNVYLVKLDLDGTIYNAILQAAQYHAVKDNALHVDFLEISMDKPVTIEIPVILNGLADGVKAGGKLQLLNRRLKVKAIPENLPETLEVDVEKLALGKSIKVGDLDFENIELLSAKNAVVASVKLTRAAKGAGLDAEGAEGAEATTEAAKTAE